jgi:uncharacterized protein (TIGR03435 family)
MYMIKRPLAVVLLLELALFLDTVPLPLSAQSAANSTSAPQSTATKNHQAFDVASIRRSKPGGQPNSNFPLGPGDVYTPNGGFFSATNQPLITYVLFAYKLLGNQVQSLVPQVPEWVTTERFDIQARAEGNPGKDDMRMMMRALLSDRFKLAIHTETREVPVLAFVLIKPGVTGRKLWPHPNDALFSEEDLAMFRSACPPSAAPDSARYSLQTTAGETTARELPESCRGNFGVRPTTPDRVRFLGRNVTIGFIANAFSAGSGFGRPMIDQTGLRGPFDFDLEFTPERPGAPPPAADSAPDDSALPFQDALREQLGIKLESRKGPLDVIVVDHIEHPTEN